MIPTIGASASAGLHHNNKKIKRKYQPIFYRIKSTFVWSWCCWLVWAWMLVGGVWCGVWCYIAVAIAPITAISIQYIMIGSIKMSISSTL